MSLITSKRSRVAALNSAEAFTRNLATFARHAEPWHASTVAADYANENNRPTGKRVRRG